MVLVPSARIAELRLQLAGAGVPKSGRTGYELFDKTKFGASDFAEQVNYQRALEGDWNDPSCRCKWNWRACINLGAYAGGANPKLDAAIRMRPQLLDFLKQDAAANAALDQTMTQMRELARLIE